MFFYFVTIIFLKNLVVFLVDLVSHAHRALLSLNVFILYKFV